MKNYKRFKNYPNRQPKENINQRIGFKLMRVFPIIKILERGLKMIMSVIHIREVDIDNNAHINLKINIIGGKSLLCFIAVKREVGLPPARLCLTLCKKV